MNETAVPTSSKTALSTSKWRVFLHFLPIIYSVYLAYFSYQFTILDTEIRKSTAADHPLIIALCVLTLPMAGFVYFRPIGKVPRHILEACGDVWGGGALIASAFFAGVLFARHEMLWTAAMTAGALWNGWISPPRLAMRITGQTPPAWGSS